MEEKEREEGKPFINIKDKINVNFGGLTQKQEMSNIIINLTKENSKLKYCIALLIEEIDKNIKTIKGNKYKEMIRYIIDLKQYLIVTLEDKLNEK